MSFDLREYGDQPVPEYYERQYRARLKSYPSSQPIYGFELELQARNRDTFKKLCALMGADGNWDSYTNRYSYRVGPKRNPIACDDGSLGVYGVEFKWWPAVIPTHYRAVSRFMNWFGGEKQFLRKFREPSTEFNYGLHVHISRSVLSERQIKALALFWHKNGNNELMIPLTGRPATGWCIAKQDLSMSNVMRDHRNAVGFRNNTVEIRVPSASSLRYKILSRLELVEASVGFTKQLARKFSNNSRLESEMVNMEAFIAFMGQYQRRWKALTYYMDAAVKSDAMKKLYFSAKPSDTQLFS